MIAASNGQMFTAVEIENFRGFGKLALEGLGRVNLVVGQNSVGKTSLLEAIALLAGAGAHVHRGLPKQHWGGAAPLMLGGPICLIDEIENGVHYTAFPDVWQFIAEVAARLDVEVFATTHSRECLIAAHEAFAARDAYELRVVQLYRLGDATSGRVPDRAHIEAAIAGDIELR